MALTLERPSDNTASQTGLGHDQPAHLVGQPPTLITWQIFSVSLLTFVMLAVTKIVVFTGPDHLDGPEFLPRALVVSGITAILTWIGASLLEPARTFAEIPNRVLALWTDPRRTWPAAVLGALLSLPMLGLFSSVGLGDADSARIVAAVGYVQDHGNNFLVETQDNFGPHLLFGPALAHGGGLAAVRLMSIISLQALVAVSAFAARRISGSMLAAVATSLALLSMPAVVTRATVVPMYPAMLVCGTLGCWLAHRAMTDGRSWRYAVGAAASLVAALEFQSVGQLFLGVPVLLLIVCPRLRPAVAGLARVLVAITFFLIPRLAVNLSDGGLSHLTSNRTDYWINKGYVVELQTSLLEYEGIGEPVGTYLERLPGRFVDSLGAAGWLALGLAVVAVVGLRGRTRVFALACTAFMVTAVTVKQIPPFARYYSPLWPGVAILAGLTIGWLARRRRVIGPIMSAVAVLTLVVLSAVSYREVAASTDERVDAVVAMPYRQLARLIDDGKGVIGSRSHVLGHVNPEIPTYGGQFLSERDYVTFLAWPSDAAVVTMMERHDIGWILINPNLVFETTYHDTWLVPAYGLEARQVSAVAMSPSFCQVADIEGFLLYHLGPCVPKNVIEIAHSGY